MINDNDLIGKTIEEASKIYLDGQIRATMIDSKACMVTMDYRLSRINVELKDGIIVRIIGRG